VRNADRNAAELLHVYGASRWQQLRFVRVPFALPYLFTGLRIEAGELRETELLWAAVLTSVVTALGVFWTPSAGEQRILHRGVMLLLFVDMTFAQGRADPSQDLVAKARPPRCD
jgi:ABC-type nitrate/sulfonate/bicarbonate transport system permease component